jgi:hypothetical protein
MRVMPTPDLHLDPDDDTRPHAPLSARTPSPPEPAIVAVMGLVWMWVAWLTVSVGAYSQLVPVRGAGLWSRSSLYFLVMLLIVGLMARKREEREAVLWTAGIVMSTITLMLML